MAKKPPATPKPPATQQPAAATPAAKAPRAAKKNPFLNMPESLAAKALAGALGELENRLGISARPTEPQERARRVFYLASKLYASGAVRAPAAGQVEFGRELLDDPTYVALRDALVELLPAPPSDQRVLKILVELDGIVRAMGAYATAASGEGKFGARLSSVSSRGLAAMGV